MATTEQIRKQAAQLGPVEKAHPTERTYVKVALVLSVITGVEIALSYIELNKWVLLAALLVLSVLKFWLVVQWFMHLRFDHPALRKPFFAGLMIAMTAYAVVLGNLVYHSKASP